MATTENLINQNPQQPIPMMPPDDVENHVPTIIEPEKQIELVNGTQEVKEMAGAKHSGVGTRLLRYIGNFVEEHNLGEVYGADASFLIGENERMLDISFVSIERIPPEGEPTGAWSFAPDLAIEVISPNDVFLKVLNKANDYFDAGVKQVWLVLPEERKIMIYRSATQIVVLSENEELVCEDILQGFRCPLRTIFRNPVQQK
jgi:Uma2 family endonuclease